MKSIIEAGIRNAGSLGCELIEVSLPHTKYAIADYYIIAPAEASSNLARYDGVKYGYRVPAPEDLLDMYKRTRSEGFGAEVKRRIMIGTYALSSGYYEAYYGRAMRVRTLIKRDYDKAFEKVDALLSPVSPTPAFKIGEKISDPLVHVSFGYLHGHGEPCRNPVALRPLRIHSKRTARRPPDPCKSIPGEHPAPIGRILRGSLPSLHPPLKV